MEGGFPSAVHREALVFRHGEDDGHGCAAALDDGVVAAFAKPPEDGAEIAPNLGVVMIFWLLTGCLAISVSMLVV